MKNEQENIEHAGQFMDFGTYDIEASNWNEVEAIGCFDGKGQFQVDVEAYPSPEEATINAIEFMLNHDVDKWYAHNGGKYDVKFFLDYLMENYYLEYCYASSSLILVEVYEKGVQEDYEDGRYTGNKPKKERKLAEFRDSFTMFPMSLDALTKSFDVNHIKQDYNQYDNHEDREKMMEYLKYDCIGLWEVIAEFMCQTNTPELNLTIASESMKQYKERFGGKEHLEKLQGNISKEKFFREAYFGGRTEVFKRKGENLKYYDFHSMYPSVMRDKPYPAGEIVRTDKFKKDKLGIYKIKWTSPEDCNIPLLPRKDKNGKLIFGTGEEIEGWYYSPEVEQAIEDGYDVEIQKGFYWTEKQYMFKDYIDHWYGVKQESDGCMYLISKLFLNSLYGKFGQSRTVTEVTQTPPTKEQVVNGSWEVLDDDLDLFTKESEVFADYIYPYVAGLVTSYGRLKLYKALKKADNVGEVYYCDTDSLVIDHELPTSPELGELGLEDNVEKGYFLFPKIYAFVDDTGESHLLSKGFKSEDLSFKDYEKAFKGDLSGFTSEWSGLVGFLEKYSRDMASSFTDTLDTTKSLKGTFDKRKLEKDGIHTKPIHLNDIEL